MKKKVLALVMASAMAISMLAACGSSDAPATTETASTDTATTEAATETTEAAAASGEQTTITIYRCTYNLASPDEDQVQKVEDKINAYLTEQGASVQVDIHDIASGEYGQKANLAFNNGEVDLLWNASWWGDGIGTNDIYAAGSAYDLTDIIPGTTLESSMDAGVWEAAKYDGKIYFVPVYKEAYEGYDLKIPQAMVDKYSVDTDSIKKIEDMEPYLEAMAADGLKYPYVAGKTAMFFRYFIDKYDFFTQNALFAVDRATNEVIDPILTEDYANFCKLMGSWYQKGYMSDDDLNKVTSDSVDQTSDWGFNWWTCVPGDKANSESRDQQPEVIIEGITGKYMHSTTALGSCFTVSATCTPEEAAACVEFLGYLYTDSNVADAYTFGVEGEDYTIVDGRVHQESDKYNHSAWESTSVKALTLLDNEDADKVDQYVSMNGAAATSCAAGFRFDKAPVEAEYTACVAIMDEKGFTLELGGVAPDAVDAAIADYQAALDAAGYQKVLEEFQNQYNAWK